jgi:CHAD domain-containing protein
MGKTDLSYCAFGARTLLKHLGRLTAEIDGVRDHAFEDTEYVHRMRVATRRLRSALPLFVSCFPANQAQAWEKEIKRITRALGEARDADVQLLVLEESLKNTADSDLERGVQRLSLRIRQNREALQERVRKAIDRFVSSGVEQSMMECFREVLGKARVEEAPLLSESIFSTAVERGMERMADALSYDDFIRDPGNVEQLHALRKSSKRLRYTLEFYDLPYNRELKPYIEEVKKLQTLLGDIHDCDVWTDFLPRFIEEETRRTMEYYGHARPIPKIKRGIEHLLAERRTSREKLYEEFLKCWDRLISENFWEKLKNTLRSGYDLLEDRAPVDLQDGR